MHPQSSANEDTTGTEVCSSGCTCSGRVVSPAHLLGWPHNQRALTWPSLYEAAGSSTHALPRFGGGDCGTSSWTLSFPPLVPVASLQHLLNPKAALGTFCHGLKERHSISKQGNVREGHRNSAMGVTAANKTCPRHGRPPQALVIWQLIKYSESSSFGTPR